MDTSFGEKVNKETQASNDTLDQRDVTDIRHSIQKQQNTLSSQVRVEHSPGQITSWVTNQALVNLVRKLKLYQTSFLTTAL